MKTANQETAIARLVDIVNDPCQSLEVRTIARQNIQKNAPHLVLPDGRIVFQDSYDRLAVLIASMEAV
jgi:hypothetical protein